MLMKSTPGAQNNVHISKLVNKIMTGGKGDESANSRICAKNRYVQQITKPNCSSMFLPLLTQPQLSQVTLKNDFWLFALSQMKKHAIYMYIFL